MIRSLHRITYTLLPPNSICFSAQGDGFRLTEKHAEHFTTDDAGKLDRNNTIPHRLRTVRAAKEHSFSELHETPCYVRDLVFHAAQSASVSVVRACLPWCGCNQVVATASAAELG